MQTIAMGVDFDEDVWYNNLAKFGMNIGGSIMVDSNGMVCEYDDYELPPVPEVVTPEMIERRNELMHEFDDFVKRVKANRHLIKEPTFN